MHAWTLNPCTKGLSSTRSECHKSTAKCCVAPGIPQSHTPKPSGHTRDRARSNRSTQTSQPTSSAAHHSPNTQTSQSTSSSQPQQTQAARRAMLIVPLTAAASLSASPASALSLKGAPCPGLNGYKLSKCLQEARKEQEQKEQEEGLPSPSSRAEPAGRLVTLPSGRQYREIMEGTGTRTAQIGDELEIQYTVYTTLRSAPILLWALGFGFENQDDVDDVYRFRFGDPGSLPVGAVPVVEGMKKGEKRSVLIPPEEGWVDDLVEPRPPTFGGKRRLISHRNEPLLFEVSLVRIV